MASNLLVAARFKMAGDGGCCVCKPHICSPFGDIVLSN